MRKNNVFNLLFTEDHNLVLDPYRPTEDKENLWSMFFGENGELDCELVTHLKSYITKNKCEWNSDPVCLYHAKQFSINTRGNYSTSTYWR